MNETKPTGRTAVDGFILPGTGEAFYLEHGETIESIRYGAKGTATIRVRYSDGGSGPVDVERTEYLSIGDAVLLGDILRSCQQNHPCTWLMPDGNGRTISGTMRAIVADDQGASFIHDRKDARDGYVWISSMFEHFIPVRDAIRWVDAGEMALNYRA